MIVRAALLIVVLASVVEARIVPPQQLIQPDGVVSGQFGFAAAMSGDTLIVGARFDDIGANAEQGSAHIYRWTGSGWEYEAKLVAADGAADDRFGSSVAIDGDTAVVGSPLDNVGASADVGSVYVFVRTGTTWTQQARLNAPDGAASDNFGGSVAIDGETVLVAVNLDDVGANTNQGSIRAFVRSGTAWSQQAVLTAPDGLTNDTLGSSIALEGDTAVVGNHGDDVGANSNQGSVRIFVRTGATWSQQAVLTAPDGAANDALGISVAISSNTVVAGVPLDDVGANADQGSARVFVRGGSAWTQQAVLTAPDGAATDNFGSMVAIDADTVVVGVSADDVGANSNQGSAHVFHRSGTIWLPQISLTAPDGAASDGFGSTVAIDGDTLVVGANADNIGVVSDQGSAWIFSRAGDTWVLPESQLIAADGAVQDFFGQSVAIDGDTAVIGVPLDGVGGNSDQGSVRVYRRTASGWTPEATLTAADGAADDLFGWSVDIDGETIVVGTPGDAVGPNFLQGSVRVFVRSGTTWSPQATLTVADGETGDYLGISVAIDGDTIVAGASSDDLPGRPDAGSARVFVRSGVTWSYQAALTASDALSSDRLGSAVAIDGNVVAVGAPEDEIGANNNQGSARVFVRSGTTWTEQATLMSPDGDTGDRVGTSIAIHQGTIVAGAPDNLLGGSSSRGSVEVFVLQSGAWVHQATLTDTTGGLDEFFGLSVAIHGDLLAVGVPYEAVGNNFSQGDVRIFTRSGSIWTQRALLTVPDGAANDRFGEAVALDDGTVLVGARLDAVGGNSEQGSARIFNVPYESFVFAHNDALEVTYAAIADAFLTAQSGQQITATESAYAQAGTLDTLGRSLGLMSGGDVRVPSTSIITLGGSSLVSAAGTVDCFGQLRVAAGASADVYADEFTMGSRGVLTTRNNSALTINSPEARLEGRTQIDQSATLSFSHGVETIGPLSAADNFTMNAGGTIANIDTASLTAGTINAPLYWNRAVTNIFGDSAIFGSFTNEIGATTTIRGGTLYVFDSLTNNGTIIGSVCSGCLLPVSPGMDVGGTLELGSAANLTMPFDESTVRVGGAFDCAINANTRYDMAVASLQMEGAGPEQTLDVMSRDIGPDEIGLDRTIAGHYPIGTLRIGPSPSTVRLVDNHDNDNLGQVTCEAIYVDTLEVGAGSRLINTSCRIYYNTLVNNGIVDVPANLVQIAPPCSVAGDANGDGFVNGADLSVLLSQFGQSVTPGTGADFNSDGLVDGRDLSVLLSNYGDSCPT